CSSAAPYPGNDRHSKKWFHKRVNLVAFWAIDDSDMRLDRGKSPANASPTTRTERHECKLNCSRSLAETRDSASPTSKAETEQPADSTLEPRTTVFQRLDYWLRGRGSSKGGRMAGSSRS